MNQALTNKKNVFEKYLLEHKPSPVQATEKPNATGRKDAAVIAEPLAQKAALIHKQVENACRIFQHVVFSTSLGMEDQILTHIFLGTPPALPVKIFTLDTGRLFNESTQLLATTSQHYGQTIHVYMPDRDEVETFVNTHGINAFRETLALRKTCCQIRKLHPLRRALAEADCWITGLRHAQSATRREHPLLEMDHEHQVVKFHPLLTWSDADMENFIAKEKIPINPLHKRGYVSIGCAPCTRAIHSGEDPRAGRWWWEQDTIRECGLHATPQNNT